VSCFAVCGAGYSYYPTEIGVRHPALKRDFTGEMTTALKKRGIRVSCVFVRDSRPLPQFAVGG